MKIRHSTATVSKTETVHAVCANFAHTASSFSLPDAKIKPPFHNGGFRDHLRRANALALIVYNKKHI